MSSRARGAERRVSDRLACLLIPHGELGAGDPARKLANLVRLLAEDATSRDAREIDLRFEEQVVLRPVVAPELGNDGPTPGVDTPGPATGVGAPRRATGDRPGESWRSPEQRKG